MKLLYTLLFVGTLFINSNNLAASSTTETAPAVETKKDTTKNYTNEDKGYSIEYPSDWEKKEIPAVDFVLLAPQKSEKHPIRATMNIISEKVEAPIDLAQLYQESIDNLKKALTDFNVKDSGDMTLDGMPAKWILYTHEIQKINIEVLQVFFSNKMGIYLITYTSPADDFAEYRPAFDKMNASFHRLTK